VDFRSLIGVPRLGFATLTFVAISAQIVDLAGRGVLSLGHFFGYFTIESNLIAAVVLCIAALRVLARHTATLDFLRGGAVLYMAMTCIGYTVLLHGPDVNAGGAWMNPVLHQVMPGVLAADWLLHPPSNRLSLRAGLGWLVFPVTWMAFTLVYGAVVGWYPYPFLDPRLVGYSGLAVFVLVSSWGMAMVFLVIVVAGNAARHGHSRAGAAL
jgi:hypothetical protein